MNEKDTHGFEFGDSYEDIISSSQKKEEFEDIVSDSRLQHFATVDMSQYGKHSYQKKKHGLAAVGQKIAKWWHKLTRGKRALVITAASIVTAIALLLTWFFTYFNYNYNAITGNPDELGFSGVIDKNVVNVALFGIDTRDETSFKGNSDSIMILSLNTKTKKVKIFSIMRDTFVPMEYEGSTYYGKINSAYAKGPEHAIKTINTIFNLDISEYATVNFYGMTDIIDAVGGITATITEDELRWKGYDHPNLNNCMDEICNQMGLDANKYYIKSAGEQQLNGVQAVAYARVRNCTSVWGTRDDFGRTDRQRHVMQELFNKAVTMKKTRYPKLAKALIPCSETSLSYSDILSLAFNVLLNSPTFEQFRLPPAEYQSEFLMRFTGGSRYGSVVYYDLDYASKLIHAVIYDDMTVEQYVEANGVERNDWFSKTGSSSSRNPTTTVTPSADNNDNDDTVTQPQTTSSENETTDEPVVPQTPAGEDEESSEEQSSEAEPSESTPTTEEDDEEQDPTEDPPSQEEPPNSEDSGSEEQPNPDETTE